MNEYQKKFRDDILSELERIWDDIVNFRGSQINIYKDGFTEEDNRAIYGLYAEQKSLRQTYDWFLDFGRRKVPFYDWDHHKLPEPPEDISLRDLGDKLAAGDFGFVVYLMHPCDDEA